jgi:hypothetical protein
MSTSAKSITAKPSATIGNFPDFITKDDLKEANELEREVKRLVQHREQVTRDVVRKKFDAAAARYSQSPTEENFATFKGLAVELMFVEVNDNYGRVRSFVHEVIRDNLIKARFLPFANAVLSRGLAAARATLADVTENEDAHHRQVTGEPLGQQSNAIVEKASRPVRELERILSSINEEQPMANEHKILTFLKFLREHAAKRGIPADFGEGRTT